jgi:Sulfate permease family
MAYATIAGLPVQVGLYTAIVPMVIYAVLGTSWPIERQHHHYDRGFNRSPTKRNRARWRSARARSGHRNVDVDGGRRCRGRDIGCPMRRVGPGNLTPSPSRIRT